jgi:DNA helicase-2/ATP-dependent DNA helicase PcrA
LIEAGHNIALSGKARSGITAFFETLYTARKLLEKTAPDAGAENAASNADDGTGTAGTARSAVMTANAGKAAAARKSGKKKRAAVADAEGLQSGEGLSVCVEQLLRDSGIAEHHQSEDEVSGNQRIYNLQELVNAASLYPLSREGLLEFLEHIELDRSLAEQPEAGRDVNDAVTLITFHNTKGLEFRRVIMTGLEQGVFPRGDKRDEELEEERRLFYVGATRAMDELYFCSCAVRRIFGNTMPVEPSLFLRELDKSNTRIIGAVPRGFNSSGNRPPIARNAPPRSESAAEKKAGWRRGDRLFHDDHGYGAVMDVRDSDDGLVVKVHFETGKELRVLSEYQGAGFVKIGRDN